MKVNDTLSGLLIGSVAAVVYLHAGTFPTLTDQNVGPSLFPELIAAGLMVCAIILVARGVRTIGKEKLLGMPWWMGANRITFGFVAIPLVLVLYVAVSESLGFIVTAMLVLLALFRIFRVSAGAAFIVAVTGALGIHFIFYKILKVPLPWGILSPVAW